MLHSLSFLHLPHSRLKVALARQDGGFPCNSYDSCAGERQRCHENGFFVVGPTGHEYRATLACSCTGNVVDMVVVKPKMLPEDKAFVQGRVCTLIGILRAPLAGPLVIRAPGQQEGADSVGHEDSENFYALSPGLLPCAPCEPSICKQ